MDALAEYSLDQKAKSEFESAKKYFKNKIKGKTVGVTAQKIPQAISSYWPERWVKSIIGRRLIEAAETYGLGFIAGGLALLGNTFDINNVLSALATGSVASFIFLLLHPRVYYDINAPPEKTTRLDRIILAVHAMAMSVPIALALLSQGIAPAMAVAGILALLHSMINISVHFYNRYIASRFDFLPMIPLAIIPAEISVSDFSEADYKKIFEIIV